MLPLENTEIEIIHIPAGRRELNQESVERLAKSIDEIGLLTPITLFHAGEGEALNLVAGAHRLAAFKQLGLETIPAYIIEEDSLKAEMWEISENLHRSELTKLERDEQVARWLELCEVRVSAQVVQKPQGGRPEGGISAASREIGVNRMDAARAKKVASLTPEAKDVARETGLNNNRSAMLVASKMPPEAQASYLRDFSLPREKTDEDIEQQQAQSIVSAWNRANDAARERFLVHIGLTYARGD